MPIGRMSKETEQKIVAAAEKVADLVEDRGVDPTDAVVKVASSGDFTPGHVRMLVRAYNTGRTAYQRESSDDVWDKAAHFKLADAEKALAQLFPDSPERAVEQHRKEAVARDYFLPPRQYIDQVNRTKAASAEEILRKNWGLKEKQAAKMPQPAAVKPKRRKKRKRLTDTDIEKKRRRIAQLESELKLASDQFFDHLHDYIPGPKTFWYLVKAKEPEDAILKAYEKKSERRIPGVFWKKACDEYALVADDPKPFSAWKRVREIEEQLAPLYADYAAEKYAYLHDRQQRRWEYKNKLLPRSELLSELGELPCPPMPKRASLKQGSTVSVLGRLLSSGFGSGSGNKGTGGSQGQTQPKNDPSSKILEEVGIPELFDARMRLKLQATLHDLMLNDEVIRSYDPYEVAVAFNEIQQSMPKIIFKPALMRTVLRKKLEQPAIDIYELKGISEVADPQSHGGRGSDSKPQI